MELLSVRMDTEDLEAYTKVLHMKKSTVVRELVEAGKKHKATQLYKEGHVSLGLGAKLASVTLSEFIDLLAEHGVELQLTKEDVAQALKTARKVW